MRKSKRLVRHWALTAALVVLSAAFLFRAECAHADMIDIGSYPAASTGNLGTFEGTIEYGFDIDLNSWTVLITLTNTSPEDNGGHITGFVFNIDSSDAGASATLHTSSHPALVNASNQNAGSFGGPYDAGASINGHFTGGGPPAGGIAVGATGSFLFLVSANDAAGLTAASFINGPSQYDFIVRFRGFDGGGSDMVPAEKTGPPVPGPTALMVLAMGLVCFKRRAQPQ